MAYSEEEREMWLLQPRASDEMRFYEEGFKAFSRLFIPRLRSDSQPDSEADL